MPPLPAAAPLSAAERAFWQREHARLHARYPGQFVAVAAGRLLAAGADLGGLLAALRGQGIAPGAVWLRWLVAPPAAEPAPRAVR